MKKAYRQARDYVLAGGQALHVYDGMPRHFPCAPACFKRSKTWAHLMDQDEDRLRATAKSLGVKRIVVGEKGTPRQHIDLCGLPLTRAIADAEKQCKICGEWKETHVCPECGNWICEGCFSEAWTDVGNLCVLCASAVKKDNEKAP